MSTTQHHVRPDELEPSIYKLYYDLCRKYIISEAIARAFKNTAHGYRLQSNVQFSQQENIDYGYLVTCSIELVIH